MYDHSILASHYVGIHMITDLAGCDTAYRNENSARKKKTPRTGQTPIRTAMAAAYTVTDRGGRCPQLPEREGTAGVRASAGIKR